MYSLEAVQCPAKPLGHMSLCSANQRESHLVVLCFAIITHRIHGAAIYGNSYHQYTPFMLAYIPAPWIRHGS